MLDYLISFINLFEDIIFVNFYINLVKFETVWLVEKPELNSFKNGESSIFEMHGILQDSRWPDDTQSSGGAKDLSKSA